MITKRFIGAAAAAAIALMGGSFAPAPAAEKVTMNALVTSSTQVPFEELVKMFEKKHRHVTIETKFLGGADIAKHVDTGTAADIVIGGWESDGKPTALAKTAASLEAPTNIYKTSDVMITQKKDKAKIKSLKDLGEAGIKVAMALPASAVGGISSQIVQKYAAGENDFAFVKRALDNVIKPQSDKESDVVAAVEKGEADAALVYASSADPSKVNIVEIPEKYNIHAMYIATVTKNAKNAKLGQEFVALLVSKEGQAVFAKHRYGAPK